MPDSSRKGVDLAGIIGFIASVGRQRWRWGIGALVFLGLGIWIFRHPLARMLLILAVLAGIGVAAWFFLHHKSPNIATVTIVGVVVLSILPIHGYLQSRPSKANFCKTYRAEKRRYLARYGRSTADPLRDFVNGMGAMSSWVPMFDRLAKVAPDEIQSDVEHIRDSLREQQQAAGGAVSDPLGGLAQGLFSGLMTMDSWERVGNYVDTNCEAHRTGQASGVVATAP